MSNINIEREYSCYEDCEMAGCPTHKATLNIQTTSDAFHFKLNDQDIYLDPARLEVLIDLYRIADYYPIKGIQPPYINTLFSSGSVKITPYKTENDRAELRPKE